MSTECTIQDVYNRFYHDYVKTYELSAAQRKVAYHIRNCKTGAFGVNVSVCEECGCISIHYNSCRDRCCPMCQEFPKDLNNRMKSKNLMLIFRIQGGQKYKSRYTGMSMAELLKAVWKVDIRTCPNCGKCRMMPAGRTFGSTG